MIIEFPRQNLKALNGQTLLEAFELLIWTADDVQTAKAHAAAADPTFPDTNIALISWIFGQYVPFLFDVDAACRRVTTERKLPDKTQRQPNPNRGSRSGDAARRQKRYIRVKVEDGAVIPAKPDAVRNAVYLILSYLEVFFQNISDGHIEIWVRGVSGHREILQRSDWRSRPDRIYLDFSNNTIRMPLPKKQFHLFSNASLALADETRRNLNKPPRLSDPKIAAWLDHEFFKYFKCYGRPWVFREAKHKFPELSEDRFDKIWDKYAPPDWKKSGTIPKKYRGIKVLK
ncbi:hypothetical protein [Labrenzia sp. PHM005]|uniref:hypothetical protein n=1 Tax=Labrenzia sp. PHM005 TaxID=2590016 RepID=UPI001140074E|nr:hypothetical protein [Labrenzia sp. PHM005]QDG76718.1 hypothetical protein FJ695_13015 [Labrenzia sp. PHM005]